MKKYGDLTPVRFSHRINYKAYWLFRCQCGNEKVIRFDNVQSGDCRSCGCGTGRLISKANAKHGMHLTRVYRIWQKMKARCLNPHNERYDRYGGRGIIVCDKWLNFEGFYEDMGEPPKGYTIERIDNNKGYSLDNCKWATRLEQSRNTCANRFITYNNETLPLSVWAERLGFPYDALRSRLRFGWPIEQAFTHPFNPIRERNPDGTFKGRRV